MPIPSSTASSLPFSVRNGLRKLGRDLAVASRFGLKPAEAKEILGQVFSVVSEWRKMGKKLRLSSATLESYASAFEHPLIDESRSLLSR